jgi:hypothetical protein
MVSILLLKHADITLSAGDVNALARGVVVHIIRVLDTWKRGHDMARPGIEHRQTSRGARVTTNRRWPDSSSAMGKLLSKVKGQREIACVLRLITAICFKSGRFT